MKRFMNLLLATVILLTLTRNSHASVTVTHDFDAWSSAAGSYTTLDFTGFPEFTQITTQYESLGATFTDGPGGITDFVDHIPSSFPLDGWGLDGGLNGEIHISFSTPQYSVATHFTGATQYWLYSSGELIYASPWFFSSPNPGEFAGLVSTQPFDSVMILDPTDPVVVVDNIYFGVPGSGALPLLAVAGLWPTSRRRRL